MAGLIDVQIIVGNEKPEWFKGCFESLKDERVNILLGARLEGNLNLLRYQIWSKGTGDWITFIDADDYIVPGAFDLIYEAIENNPTASIITTDEYMINRDGVIIGKGPMFGQDINIEHVRAHPRIAHHITCYKREALEIAKKKILEYNYGVEWIMSCAASSIGDVVKIKKPLYYWRKYEGQSHKMDIQNVYTGHLAKLREELKNEYKAYTKTTE